MHEHDNGQSRRTNILIGNEVLMKIDDSQNVTHQNGVAKIEVTKVSNPLNIGQTQLIYDGNLSYQHHAETTPRQLATLADLTWQSLGGTPPAPPQHTHEDGNDLSVNARGFIGNEQLAGTIAIVPEGILSHLMYYYACDGYAIERTLPAGQYLVSEGCPFGEGDGATTVNLPTLTGAPAGCVYAMHVGLSL